MRECERETFWRSEEKKKDEKDGINCKKCQREIKGGAQITGESGWEKGPTRFSEEGIAKVPTMRIESHGESDRETEAGKNEI